MSSQWLRRASFMRYGVTLAVGLGVPIPIAGPGAWGEASYARLKSGAISVNGKEVKTAGLSSYARAREIAGILKGWIQTGSFLLTEPVAPLPSADSGVVFRPLRERAIESEAPAAGSIR